MLRPSGEPSSWLLSEPGESARTRRHRAKFPNLLPFGCWWFLNNPVLIEEMTRMRNGTAGLEFRSQHSDARVLDRSSTNGTIPAASSPKFWRINTNLLATGWSVTEEKSAVT